MLVKALLLPGVMLATGVLSFIVAETLRRQSSRLGFTDQPNDRSLHTASTPRAGGAGFALLVPVAATLALWMLGDVSVPEGTILLTALGVAAVGLIDDRWSLPAPIRLLCQSLAALVVVRAGVVLHDVSLPGGAVHSLGRLGPILSFLWLVALTNAYNFMDGIDGIAATQGLITASTMAAVAVCLGRYDIAVVMATLDAGLVGFLVLNWPPARIFMGDVGSTFLGFMFAAWSILPAATESAAIPFVAWVVVLAPFLFDTSVTLVRRLFRREPIFTAHRTHIYQQLVQAGWTHTRTTLLYAGMALWAGALTVLHYGFTVSSPMLYLLCGLLPLALPVFLVRRRHLRRTV